ncbi:MAG: hypothetical protein AAFY41_13355, partial [Bacteroidota bacterium]
SRQLESEGITIDHSFISKVVNENTTAIQKLDQLFEKVLPSISADQAIKAFTLIEALDKKNSND